MALLLRISLVLAAALALAGAGAAGFAWYWTHQPLAIDEPASFEVAPGERFAGLTAKLHAAGIVEQPLLLRLYGRVSGLAGQIKAGEYELQPGDSPRGLLERLAAGRIKLHSITLVEGWTVARMLEELARREELAQTVTHLDAERLMPALGFDIEHAEGWFYPDTYRVARGTTDAELLRQAHRRMRRELAKAWRERAPELALDEPYEALILASVIEKETGRPEERAKVSQVFNSRLELGMRLQTDPTVIYGAAAELEDRLRRHHLRSEHPYNTYIHAGLPPTPIALPGRASLRAAVQPAETDYLYFVARGDGTSEFTRNLEDHLAAVRRYQLGRGD